MITLTENAASAIQGLTQQADAPEGSGLRISSDRSDNSLNVHLAAAPEQGDAVVEAHGAKVFLDEGAANTLDGKQIHATADIEGQVQFTILNQAQ